MRDTPNGSWSCVYSLMLVPSLSHCLCALQEKMAWPLDSEQSQLLTGASQALEQHSPSSLAITLRHYAAVHKDMHSNGKLAQLPQLMQVQTCWDVTTDVRTCWQPEIRQLYSPYLCRHMMNRASVAWACYTHTCWVFAGGVCHGCAAHW